MADHLEDFSFLRGPTIFESPTSSKKSGGKVINKDLQATMVQVLKSIEKTSLETIGEVSKLCSLTRSLQRRLDLEYPTLKDGYAREIMREESLEKEPVIPLFPLLEEKNDRGKKKVEPRTSQPEVEEILETDMPNPLLFPLDSRGKSGKIRKSVE
ncbi:hypothetical protein ACFX1T_012567 [Malus domestica]